MLFNENELQNAGRRGAGYSNNAAYAQSGYDRSGAGLASPQQERLDNIRRSMEGTSSGRRGYSNRTGYGGNDVYAVVDSDYDQRQRYGQSGYGSRSESGSYAMSRAESPYGSAGGYDSYGQSRGYDLNQGVVDSMSPLAIPKEVFVNVTVTGIEEDNPLNHVKNWFGGLKNGQHVQGEVKATEISPDIANVVRRTIQYHGWDSDPVLMNLPPSHGAPRWSPYLRLGVEQLPFLMVFRVQLRTKLKIHQDGRGLAELFAGCCDMFVPNQGIPIEEFEAIGMEITDGLRRQQFGGYGGYGGGGGTGRVVRAEIQVCAAPGEFHVLKSKGWTPDLAAQAIIQARNNSPGADPYGQQYGYGQQGVGSSLFGGSQQGVGSSLFGRSQEYPAGSPYGGSNNQQMYGNSPRGTVGGAYRY